LMVREAPWNCMFLPAAGVLSGVREEGSAPRPGLAVTSAPRMPRIIIEVIEVIGSRRRLRHGLARNLAFLGSVAVTARRSERR